MLSENVYFMRSIIFPSWIMGQWRRGGRIFQKATCRERVKHWMVSKKKHEKRKFSLTIPSVNGNKLLYYKIISEAVTRRRSIKKVFLKISQNSQETTCVGGSFFNKAEGLKPATLLKKETPTQLFSCELCEIFRSSFFHRTPPTFCVTTTRWWRSIEVSIWKDNHLKSQISLINEWYVLTLDGIIDGFLQLYTQVWKELFIFNVKYLFQSHSSEVLRICQFPCFNYNLNNNWYPVPFLLF